MQWFSLSPGFMPLVENIADPLSSSDNATEPAVNVLAPFVVVAVNAAFVPDNTAAALMTTATRPIRAFWRERDHPSRRARRVRATPFRRPTSHLPPPGETSPPYRDDGSDRESLRGS